MLIGVDGLIACEAARLSEDKPAEPFGRHRARGPSGVSLARNERNPTRSGDYSRWQPSESLAGKSSQPMVSGRV